LQEHNNSPGRKKESKGHLMRKCFKKIGAVFLCTDKWLFNFIDFLCLFGLTFIVFLAPPRRRKRNNPTLLFSTVYPLLSTRVHANTPPWVAITTSTTITYRALYKPNNASSSVQKRESIKLKRL